ncbi:MAG: hypothetical protein MZW92_78700 [Comamonadaceae bacterium]|nr:hypothetical protein [Comamonadaceae bacterium]
MLPGPRYRGVVWDHASLRDGTLVTTSAVVELKNGRILTRSGSVYALGRTFYSEQHAAEQTGLRLSMEGTQSPQALQVIDLESDDISALDTFAHGRLFETP